MKAWTYDSASSRMPYWQSFDVNVILVEYNDHRLEWRRADTGALHISAGGPYDYHKGRLLPTEHWPQWYQDLDECDIDVGL